MAESTRVSTWPTKNTDSASTIGPTVVSMLDSGRTDYSTAKASTGTSTRSKEWVYGKPAKEFSGWMKRTSTNSWVRSKSKKMTKLRTKIYKIYKRNSRVR